MMRQPSTGSSLFSTLCTLLLALLLMHCGPTQLVVQVPSDMMAETDLTQVVIRVSRLNGTNEAAVIREETFRIGVTNADGKKTIPVSLGVVAARADDTRRVLVTVRGVRAAGEDVVATAIVAFFPRKTVFYDLFLAGACTQMAQARCRRQGQVCTMGGMCTDEVRLTGNVLEGDRLIPMPVPPESTMDSGVAFDGASSDVFDATNDRPVAADSDVPSLTEVMTPDVLGTDADATVGDSPDVPNDVPSVPSDIPNGAPPEPSRQIAPLSTTVMAHTRPTLRWEVPPTGTSALVTVCRNRMMTDRCFNPAFTVNGTGRQSFTFPNALTSGWYYWRVTSVREGLTSTPSPVWQYYVREQNANGSGEPGLSSLSDFNGDGVADYAIGSPRNGQVLLFQSSGGAHDSITLTNMPVQRFGAYLSSAGDLDGDGLCDLVVAGDNGDAIVYYGTQGAGITGMSRRSIIPRTFGGPVVGVGDVNGDGFGDVVNGAFGEPRGGLFLVGAAYVYRGGSSGVSMMPAQTILGPVEDSAQFGKAVAGGGDFNGDGYADVAIGAPGALMGAGAVTTFLGGPANLTMSTLLPGLPLEALGNAVAVIGDVNGDGYADLASGGTGLAIAQVSVNHGSAMGIVVAPTTTVSDMPLSLFGSSLSSAGDMNNDGFADLLVGTPNGAGRARLYLGSAMNLPIAHAIEWSGTPGSMDRFGASLANAGDVNNDGMSDVLVGAPNGMNRGAVYLFRGPAQAVPSVRYDSMGNPGEFGHSVAQLQLTLGPQWRGHERANHRWASWLDASQSARNSSRGVFACVN